MKILLNATTLRKGGPLQRAVTFIIQVRDDPLGHAWHFAVSDAMMCELSRLDGTAWPDVHVFHSSPARDLASRRRLAQLAGALQPACVFTFAGPSYVKFRAPHLLGFTNPWLTHSTWQAYRTTSFPHQWIRKAMQAAYSAYWLWQADAWVVQTETGRQGLHRRFRVPLERIGVVPNTCGSVYHGASPRDLDRPAPKKWRFLCFAASYPHKRLELVPEIANEFRAIAPGVDFEFVLTLPDDSRILRAVMRKATLLGVCGHIDNVGPIPIAEGPRLYQSCDVCILPTVLETFTATYPEAMAMNVPIVTTNLRFATDVCQDAALYFEPNHARDAAAQLYRLVSDPVLRRQLVTKGREILAQLPSPREQYMRYVELLTRLAADARN